MGASVLGSAHGHGESKRNISETAETGHSLVVLEVLLGLPLLSFLALRQAGMDVREVEDVVNDFGRPAVGGTKEEAVRRWCILIDQQT